MTAVGTDNTWAWVATLPDGLDETTAKVYEQTPGGNRIQLGGRHYLFHDGQVWMRAEDGRWKRGIVTAGDLADTSLFTPVTV